MGSNHKVEGEEQMTTDENRGTVGMPEVDLPKDHPLMVALDKLRLESDTEVWILDELMARKEPLSEADLDNLFRVGRPFGKVYNQIHKVRLDVNTHNVLFQQLSDLERDMDAVKSKHYSESRTTHTFTGETKPCRNVIKLFAPKRFDLSPGKSTSIKVNENVSIPEDAYGQFFIRKKHALEMINAPQCVFHSGWSGEPTIILMNLGNTIFEIKEGEELGEIVLLKGAL